MIITRTSEEGGKYSGRSTVHTENAKPYHTLKKIVTLLVIRKEFQKNTKIIIPLGSGKTAKSNWLE